MDISPSIRFCGPSFKQRLQLLPDKHRTRKQCQQFVPLSYHHPAMFWIAVSCYRWNCRARFSRREWSSSICPTFPVPRLAEHRIFPQSSDHQVDGFPSSMDRTEPTLLRDEDRLMRIHYRRVQPCPRKYCLEFL